MTVTRSLSTTIRALGCPPKTLGTRLARGRALLGRRLIRLVVSLSAGGLAVALTLSATAAVSTRLLRSTVEVAIGFATGSRLAASPAVMSLTVGVLNVTTFKPIKCFALVICGLIALAGLTVGAEQPASAIPAASAAQLPKSPDTDDPSRQAGRPGSPIAVSRAAPEPKLADTDDLADQAEVFAFVGFNYSLTLGAKNHLGLAFQDRLYRAVAKDLNLTLTAKQVEVLNAVWSDMDKDSVALSQLTGIEDRKRYQQKVCREYLKSVNAFWSGVLKPEQLKRLAQIEWQFRGTAGCPSAGGLGYPAIQAALKLTADQQKEIQAINDEVKADWDAKNTVVEWGPDPNTPVYVNSPARCYSLFSSAQSRALKLLTDEQRKAWKEMIGNPLDLEPIVGQGCLVAK